MIQINTRSIFIIGLTAALAASLTACGKAAEAETPKRAAKTAAQKPALPRGNLLLDASVLQAARQALAARSEFRGKTVYVFDNINFFDGVRPRIELLLQDPADGSRLLFYRYENGVWHGRPDDAPEELVKNMERHLTPLNDIRFEDVPRVARQWQAQAQSVGAVWQQPYHVAFIFLQGKQPKRFWHTPEIEANGAQYYLSMNLDGTVWEFKRL